MGLSGGPPARCGMASTSLNEAQHPGSVILKPTAIPGCVVIRPQRHADERGYFARTWDANTFADQGLATSLSQCSTSFSRQKGTLRGMHYQDVPHQEAKLVRCTRGAIWDVCLDLRPDSPTYRQWHGATLSEDNGLALYLPEGCAHGHLTLEPNTEVFYMISAPYVPEAGRGVRWDDSAFGIDWPFEPVVLNERDASYPSLDG